MGTVDDSLRLVLIALNELKQVAVLAAAEEFAPELRSLGVVKGREQLETFLETAAVDHYVVTYGQPFASTFRPAPIRHSWQQIIEDLEKGFREAGELRAKLSKRETLSEDELERLRFAPRSWMVWSSTLSSADGMARVRAWFAEKKVAAEVNQESVETTTGPRWKPSRNRRELPQK